MALQPTLRPLLIAGRYDAPHTLDIFLDYVCPFSAKLSFAIDKYLKPLADEGGPFYGKVKVIMRCQLQPWHATTTYTHEAGLAVARVAPEYFWPFSLALFKHQTDFFDEPALNMTVLQIREKLAQLAATVLPAEKVVDFKEILKPKAGGNGGTGITDDIKYNVKFTRQNGIHVSPSALWDGIFVPDVSSSWGEKEWAHFLETKVLI